MEVFQGPDFATGGVIVDSPAAIAAAYESGKRQLPRPRARSTRAEAEDARRIARPGSSGWAAGSGSW